MIGVAALGSDGSSEIAFQQSGTLTTELEDEFPQLIPASTTPHIPTDPDDILNEQLHLPAIHHSWARYPVGAWREMEITTETFDDEGNLYGKSVTQQVEILKSVGEDSYQLDVQATVDISGKQIAGGWNTRSLRLINDRPGQILYSEAFGDETLQVDMREVPCQVLEVTSSEEARNRTERIYYSPEYFPHILRRDVLDSEAEEEDELVVRDSTAVKALAIPYFVGNRVVECCVTHTTRRQEKGSSVTVRFVAQDIPGGEVASWSSDFNSSGRRIRWSVSKLVDHGLAESAPTESRADSRLGRRRAGRVQ